MTPNADYRRLAPGVYAGPDETLHLDVAELLADNGIEDNAHNREMVAKTARDAFAQLGIPVEET